jgi:hypothetical protein
MKPIIPMSIVLLALLAPTVHAQASEQSPLSEQALEAKRSARVGAALDLTAAQEKAFWPLYESYRAEVATINGRRFKLTMDFMDRRGSLTDDEAQAMLADYLGIESAYVSLLQSYAQKFSTVLPPAKVLLLFQTEDELDGNLGTEVAAPNPPLGG